jgi:hypothetical protein
VSDDISPRRGVTYLAPPRFASSPWLSGVTPNPLHKMLGICVGDEENLFGYNTLLFISIVFARRHSFSFLTLFRLIMVYWV